MNWIEFYFSVFYVRRYVVTGDVNGHVKFYDLQLRMSNWYNEFDVGPLNSVSFAYVSDFVPE